MTGRGAGGFLCAVVVAISVSGCNTGDSKLRPPRVGPLARRSERGDGREIVLIQPFVDHRDRERCGLKRGLFNLRTKAVVTCAFKPADLLARLVAEQLTAVGFVVLEDRTQAAPSTLIVSGALEQMFVEPVSYYFGVAMEADVALVLTARTPSGFTARRRFYVKGEKTTGFPSSVEMEVAMAASVRQLLVNVVGAIANLADRVPAEGEGEEEQEEEGEEAL